MKAEIAKFAKKLLTEPELLSKRRNFTCIRLQEEICTAYNWQLATHPTEMNQLDMLLRFAGMDFCAKYDIKHSTVFLTWQVLRELEGIPSQVVVEHQRKRLIYWRTKWLNYLISEFEPKE